MSDWLQTTGTEFGEVDNPEYPGNSKASWDTTDWNKGAWGDDISGWHNQGVALPNAPRGTRVEVRNPNTGETTIAEVKDVGPGRSTGAGIDLLPGTGSAVGLPTNYKGPVEYRVLGGGVMDEHQEAPDRTQVSKLPEHLDLTGWDQPHNEPAEFPTTVEPPPVAKSLIQEFYDKNPATTVSQQGILNQMHKLYAPDMPEEEFKKAATTPGGIDIIKEWKERQKTPLEQLRDEHPEWSNYSDDKLIGTLWDVWTKNKQIDPTKITYDEFMWRMKPPTDALNQFGRFVDETLAEVGPKTASTVLWSLSGLEQHALDNAEPTIRGILAKAYSPDSDLDQLFKKYQGMSPEERKKEFAQAWATLKQGGGDSARLLDQINTTFQTIDKASQIQESIDWMKKSLVTLDAPGPNQLPAGQEKWAQTIAALPAQAVQAIIPGVRELSLFGNLYAENKAAIEKNNPGMSNAEVAQKAEAATWWAFPGNELLQLSFLRGGPAIQGTILNRIKGIGIELGKEAGLGAGVGGANQVITNIAAGRDPMEGVFESSGTMATLGLGGRALGLTVEGLARAMKHVPEVRQAIGISSDIVGATPEEANKIVRGDPTAEVNQKATRNSIDLILSATQRREERRILTGGGARTIEEENARITRGEPIREPELTITEEPTEGGPEAILSPEQQRAEERRITAGRRTAGEITQRELEKDIMTGRKRGYQPAPSVVPEQKTIVPEVETPEPAKTPSEEAFDKAKDARDKGDLKTASTLINQGTTLLADDAKKEHHKKVADGFQGVVRNNSNAKVKNVEEFFGLSDVPGKRLGKRGEAGAAFNIFGGRRRIEGERIVSAASRQGDETRTGRTHAESDGPWDNPERGFMTNKGRFVSRQEAHEIASGGKGGALYAENLVPSGELKESQDPVADKLALLGLDDTPQARAIAQRALRADESGKETILVSAMRAPDGQIIVSEFGHDAAAKKIRLPRHRIENGYLTNTGRFVDSPMDLARQIEAETEGAEEAEAFSGGNPLPFIRKAAQGFRKTDVFRKRFDAVSRTLAPQRRGEGAKDTAALAIGVTSRVKTGILLGLKAIAEHLDMNTLFHDAYRSDRRDAKWRQVSDEQIKAWQTIKENGGKIANPIYDKLFDFTRECYDWLEDIGRANGVKFGHIANYFHHAFKNPEGEVETFLKDWEAKYGKQAFQKERHYATLADAIDIGGLTPKTYSPERNLMAYAAAMTTAIRQIQTLKSMAEENLALPTTDVKEQGLTKQKGWSLHTAPDGNSYYVRNDAAGVLANAFDLHSIYDTMAGPFVGFARAFKGVTGIKLSWSVFHPVHIAGIAAAETLTTAMQRGIQGTGTAKDVLDAITAASTFGVGPMAGATQKYGRLVDALTTGRGLDQLTDQQKADYNDLLEMGIVPYMSDDRRSLFADMMFRGWKGAEKTRSVIEFGYKMLTLEPYQEFMFGKVIPATKIAAALARRDTLLRKNGEAFRSPENNMARKREYLEINRDVEGRFGEMCYDNLFWARWAKQVGLAIPLSLGWNLGFWRVYGDGVIDLMDNAAHMAKLNLDNKKAPGLSNRLLYMANYTAMSMLTNAILTFGMTQTIPQVADFFFPRIGKKPNGDDERVRTPFWTGEIASLSEHIQENIYKNQNVLQAGTNALAQYFGNKANPGLASIWHLFNNKDFMGRDIYDYRDPFNKQLMDAVSFALADMIEPISWQGGKDSRGIPNEPKQVIMSFLGFTQAPGWTTRTPLQNEIITMFHDQLNAHMTKRQGDIFDAKSRYQYAIVAGDQRMQMDALATLHQLGAGPRVIEDARKFAKIPPAHRAYQGLNADNQEYLLKRMSPSEYHEYWPITKAQAKMEYVRTQ